MIEVLAINLDQRLRAFCATIRCNYDWYISASRGAEQNLAIQRKIIGGSKSYATLRRDLGIGCLLPSIVIAADVDCDARLTNVEQALTDTEEMTLRKNVSEKLQDIEPFRVKIVDGLQRTNAIRQVIEDLPESERAKFLARPLQLEVWLNISFSALAYRMLLLNAGQKPMSMKHQIEVLSQPLKSDLVSIPALQIIEGGQRRVQPSQFQLSKLALAFQAWLQGNPNVDVRNAVVEQLLSDSAVETLGIAISEGNSEAFKKLVGWLVDADEKLGTAHLEFFGSETVLQGISAAVGSSQRNQHVTDRVESCLTQLVSGGSTVENLAIPSFEFVRKGIDPSRKNVGEATRDLVFTAFQEHFYSDGKKSMRDCWEFAGAKM